MQYCRTNKAIKWLEDGDIIQNLTTDTFFEKVGSQIFSSSDLKNWEEFKQPMETFPPYDEWRSIMNLHYYDDVKGEKFYLTPYDKAVTEEHPEADKTKKRWFTKIL